MSTENTRERKTGRENFINSVVTDDILTSTINHLSIELHICFPSVYSATQASAADSEVSSKQRQRKSYITDRECASGLH